MHITINQRVVLAGLLVWLGIAVASEQVFSLLNLGLLLLVVVPLLVEQFAPQQSIQRLTWIMLLLAATIAMFAADAEMWLPTGVGVMLLPVALAYLQETRLPTVAAYVAIGWVVVGSYALQQGDVNPQHLVMVAAATLGVMVVSVEHRPAAQTHDLPQSRSHQQSVTVTLEKALPDGFHVMGDDMQQSIETIRTVIQQQVDQTARQSVAVDGVSSALKSIAASVQSTHHTLQHLAEAIRTTTDKTNASKAAVNIAVEEIASIQQAVSGVGNSMEALVSDLRRASDIVTFVSDIATQSNFLALNAQIEAARAGESGRGFSIVADEVRDLADQSRQSTHTMKLILRSIHRASSTAVAITESTSIGVSEGVRQTEALHHAVDSIHDALSTTEATLHGLLARFGTFIEQLETLMHQTQQLNQSTMQSQASMLMAQNISQNLEQLIDELRGA